MEAAFFRKIATGKIKIARKIMTEKLDNADTIDGMLDEMEEEHGEAVKRWSSVVQLVLLGIALALIIAVTITYLFL
jgi:hypothetical protein